LTRDANLAPAKFVEVDGGIKCIRQSLNA